MIALKSYSKEFEEEYYKIVEKYVDENLQNDIIESCKKYFPPNFFDKSTSAFKKLVLMTYKEIKEVYVYINENALSNMEEECFKEKGETEEDDEKDKFKELYKKLHGSYEKIAYSQRKKVQMNVEIVRESKILTCPYCNRDYINSRGGKVSGAQLDHFYNRSRYPIFSICLYNLIPVCGNCNRVKSKKDDNIISPFDEEIDFNSSLKFYYKPDGDNEIALDIVASNGLENNIQVMKIKEAYKIHDENIKEWIDKSETYNKTQTEEIINTFKEKNISISSNEFKKLIFGVPMNLDEFGKKPLSKLKYDILKDLNII